MVPTALVVSKMVAKETLVAESLELEVWGSRSASAPLRMMLSFAVGKRQMCGLVDAPGSVVEFVGKSAAAPAQESLRQLMRLSGMERCLGTRFSGWLVVQ